MSRYKNFMRRLEERMDELNLDLNKRLFHMQITEYFFSCFFWSFVGTGCSSLILVLFFV